MTGLDMAFRPTRFTDGELALRHEVREFVREEFPPGEYRPHLGFGGHSPDFSRRLAARGWVGMAIPREYGGRGRTVVERFVVVEELLRAGAPVGAHWVADRQSGPVILAFGTEAQRERFLPAISAGECYFSIGMSEPDSGSDLASVRTTAERVPEGWRLRGRKIWTSNAHVNHFAIVLCRTSPQETDRHAGLSQFIVDLHAPGVVVRPLYLIDGGHHFNELELNDVIVPDDMLLGQVGGGWRQVTSELTFERAGPDRYLSTFPLLERFVATLGPDTPPSTLERLGRLGSRLWTIRQLGLAVARAVDAGAAPGVQAALVKDLGTTFEQEVVAVLTDLVDGELSQDSPSLLMSLLADAVLNAPTYTIRGGTTEVLRMIAARGLGVGR